MAAPRKKLAPAVVLVVLVLLVIGDLAARRWAESKLASRVAGYYQIGGVPPPGDTGASIKSFPFVGRILFFGRVSTVTVSIKDLEIEPILVRRLTVSLDDVDIDRAELFKRRVKLRDIGEGTVEALLDGPSVSRALGADIRFLDGEVEIHQMVAGADVFARAKASIRNNVLRLEPTSVQGAGVPLQNFALDFEIPGADLLPCAAEGRAVKDGLLVSCRVADVPPSLVRAAQ